MLYYYVTFRDYGLWRASERENAKIFRILLGGGALPIRNLERTLTADNGEKSDSIKVVPNVLMVISDAFPSEYAKGPSLTCELIADQISLRLPVSIVTVGYDRLRKIRMSQSQLLPSEAEKKINRIFLTPGFKKYIELAAILRINKGPIFLHCLFEYRLVLPALVLALLTGHRKLYHLPHGMLLDATFAKHKIRKKTVCLLLKWTFLGKYLTHVVSSELEKQDVLEKIGHNQSVILIQQPAEVDSRFRPTSFRGRTLGSPLRICSIGRICRQKNLIFILETLRQIEFNIVLNIYGDIEDRVYFKSCVEFLRQLPNQIQVNFCGQLSRNNLLAEVANNDLMFLPTLGENHGHAILEALALGCPVLISNLCPWIDVTAKGAGWSYDLNDRKNFAAALRTAYHSGPDWAKMRQAAFNYFDEKRVLSKDKYVEMLHGEIEPSASLDGP